MSVGYWVAILWVALGAIVVSMVSRLITRAAAYLEQREAHIRNVALRDALEFATKEARSAAQTVVTGLDHTMASALKRQGKWDAAAARAVKDEAVSLMNSVISLDAKAVLQRAFSDLPTLFGALIEEVLAGRRSA